MNELQVVVNYNPNDVEFNFEEVKAMVEKKAAEYKGVLFHEDTIKNGKSEVAYLRKQIEIIETGRKNVKNICLKPYQDFEIKAKELIQIIQNPIDEINKQLDVFEEKRKEKKKEEITLIYNELIGELKEYLPFAKIYNTKWENVSIKIKAIRDELEQVINSTSQAIQTIKGMNSEAVPKALEQFKFDLSLVNAITYINRYEQQKAEILAKEEAKRKQEEERQRLAEIERVKREERERVSEEDRIKEAAKVEAKAEVYQEVKEEIMETLSASNQSANEPTRKAKVILTATEREQDQIAMYLNSIGIEFEWWWTE